MHKISCRPPGLMTVLSVTLSVTFSAVAGAKMDLKSQPVLSEAELRATYGQVDVTKPRHPAFDFSILRPRGTEQYDLPDAEPTPSDNLAQLALFGKTGENYAIEVDVILLPREMSAAGWLAAWLEGNGYQVLDKRLTKTPAGDLAEVMATRTINGIDFVYRMKTYKDGPYIFLVQGRAPMVAYAQHAGEIGIAVNRFALTHPTGAIAAEPLTSYDMPHPRPARFKMPASWIMSPDPVMPPNGTSLRFKAEEPSLHHVYGNMVAVTLPLSSARTADEVETTYLAALHAKGVTMDSTKLIHMSGARDAWMAERAASLNGGPMHISTRVHRGGEGWVFFGMLMSDPNVKLLALQASAQRALEIAEESFRWN